MGRLNAGSLTERIGLLSPGVATPDGQGGFLPAAPATPVVVHARKRELSGMEAIRLGQTLGSSVVEFTIRYRPAVTHKTGVMWQGKTLGVRQVTHDDFKEFTVLTCVDNGRN